MTTKERIETALRGGTPDVTPYTIYNWFVGCFLDQPIREEWQPMFDQGLGLAMHVNPVDFVEHGVESTHEVKMEGSTRYDIYRKKTPVGTIQKISKNGWHYQDWLKEPADYLTRQWIIEHTEQVPHYERVAQAQEIVGDNGVVLLTACRTPAMVINIDWAGTQQFCMDLAEEVEELFSCYAAQRKQFLEQTQLLAACPGEFVKRFENLTISMLGPRWYRELLMPVYEETYPILNAAGKRVIVHYDGELAAIRDDIARAKFDVIESLHEAPEGNMRYEDCRAAWPDTVFWAGINLHHYEQPCAEFREVIADKQRRAGKKGLLFCISEDVPANWQERVPFVLRTLEELG